MAGGMQSVTALPGHLGLQTFSKRLPVRHASPRDSGTAGTTPGGVAAVDAAPLCRFQYIDEDFTQWGLSFLPFLEEADG